MKYERTLVWVFFAFAITLAVFSITWRYQIERPLKLQQQAYYTIYPGDSASAIAHDIADLGLVNNSLIASILFRLSDNDRHIHAGTYLLDESMSLWEFVQSLTLGHVARQGVRIGEGWTLLELKRAVKRNAWLAKTPSKKIEQKNLGQKKTLLEGLLLPDTYLVEKDASLNKLLQRAHVALYEFLQGEWPRRSNDAVLKTPYEAIILASIVEKETNLPEERSHIAGVLTQRLKKHMLLQADPTVRYGISPDFQGRLSRKQLRLKTPYNTYRVRGLPPTPIAFASRDSIVAVLHPQATEDLYYVAKGDKPGHVFSKTLKDHKIAVRAYRAHLKEKL